MAQKTRPQQLSWLFLLLSIACVGVFGMEPDNNELMWRIQTLKEEVKAKDDFIQVLNQDLNIKREETSFEKENEILVANKELEAKNKFITSLTEQNEILMALVDKQRTELANQTKIMKEFESILIQKENRICNLGNKIKSTFIVNKKEISDLQKKEKVLMNDHETIIKPLTEKLQKYKIRLEKEKQMSNQELLKYQTLNAKLDLENVTLKQKENFLKEMINNHAEKLQKFPKKLQNIEKIILETSSPKESKNSEIKVNRHQNKLDNETDSNQNVEMEAKEKLKKYQSLKMKKKNHESLKLENHENKKTLTNCEDNSQANPVTIIKSETDETQVNLETKTIPLNNDKKTKLTKYEPENNLKALLKFQIDHLPETVPKAQTLYVVKSKEEKKMKRKNDQKQIKILNAIEQILLKSMPTVKKKKSAFYNQLVAVRKSEQEIGISKFLQQLRKSEDEDLMLKIKSYLKNKETLIEDPKYQYESLFMNIGVIHFAHYCMMNSLKPVDNNTYNSCCIDDDFGEYTNFVAEMQKLYEKHERILDDMLESVKDEKLKIKVKCFRENECLFKSQKYEYENLFRTIGYIVYGYGNNVQEEFIQLENQNLKNETISLESVKSLLRKNKQNLTNVETKILESPPMELYANLMKSKQMEHEENEESMESEKQILKNRNLFHQSHEFIQLANHQKQQNFENETNVETKFLETQPTELNEGLMKLKEMNQGKKETSELQVANNNMRKNKTLKQKAMLDSIEQILYESRPSPNEKKRPTFKKIYAQREREHTELVIRFIQKLLDQEDQQLISDINLFLENKHTLNTDPKYQYEIILMHLGAMSHNHDMIKKIQSILNSDFFLRLEDDCKQDWINYTTEVQKLYNKHEKIVIEKLESMENEKLKIKIKCLTDKTCLYDLPQYKYDSFIRMIGIIVYWCGDHLAEF